MSEGLAYDSLTQYQRQWLKGCRKEVIGIKDGFWQVTISRRNLVVMRDIVRGDMDEADAHGRQLGYKAALVYAGG